MVPGHFIRLDTLPLTPAGTVDRSALPAPEESAAPADEPVMPGDGAGRIVAEIWQELLEVERVALRDNFFALGGHSLLLLPMQERIRDRFGVTLPVVELFKFPTAGALAAHLAEKTRAEEVSHPAGTTDRREALRQGRERLKRRADLNARKTRAR
jgi:acyl carrier protein